MKLSLHIKPSEEVIEQCMLLSNNIIFDKMHDNSFAREKSDKGIDYVFENIDNIILFNVMIDDESFTIERCIHIEIRDRDNYVTYLLSMEFHETNVDELVAIVQDFII